MTLAQENPRRPAYGPSPIKRARRTKAQMQKLRDALIDIVNEGAPMTVRQVFYQATVRGLIAKEEKQYKATGRQLVLMRRSGDLSFDKIADETRWMRRPTTYGSAEDALRMTAILYRRQVWADLDARVEVWLEKEALAGVLVDVTEKWDVPLMVTRGYPSLSFLHAAAEAIEDDGKPTYIYYFGDRDPSGRDITRYVEKSLREFAPNADIEFELVAVTDEQIRLWKLPTRPTKKTDTRARGFRGGSVEVDAIHPERLRELCEECIAQHIPAGHMTELLAAEKSEKDILMKWARKLGKG